MNNSMLSIFEFNDSPVRVSAGQDGATWFVAADVCRVLEIGNHRQATAGLENDEKDGVSISDAIGRIQETTCISESGLYALIFKSRKPQAKAFRKWVTGEVLPAIRKSGRFEAPASATPAPLSLESVLEHAFQASARLLDGTLQASAAKTILSLTQECRRLLALQHKTSPAVPTLPRMGRYDTNTAARLSSQTDRECQALLRAVAERLSSAALVPMQEVFQWARKERLLQSIVGDGRLTMVASQRFGRAMRSHLGSVLTCADGRKFRVFWSRRNSGVFYSFEFVKEESL
jgi:prophage antirepressor-like protein